MPEHYSKLCVPFWGSLLMMAVRSTLFAFPSGGSGMIGASSCWTAKSQTRTFRMPRGRVCIVMLCCIVQSANAEQIKPANSIVQEQCVLRVRDVGHYLRAMPDPWLEHQRTFATGILSMMILLGSVLQQCFCFGTF